MRKGIFIIIASFVLITSCTKDFLDTMPQTDIPAEEAISSLRLANSAVFGIYDNFQGLSYYGQDLPHIIDVMGDHILGAVSYSGAFASQYKFDITADDGYAESIWQNGYLIIDKCNNILEQIDNLDPEDNVTKTTNSGVTFDRHSVKAQALMARAWVYFDLVRLYGKAYTTDKSFMAVPLVLESPKDLLAHKPSRSSVEAIYTQIVKDLDAALAAYDLSTEKYQYTGTYYMDKGVCEGLLARVYLHMGNMAKAAEYAVSVINSGKYQLVDAVNDNNTYQGMWSSESGNEIMWGIANSSSDDAAGMDNYYLGHWDPVVPKPDYIPATWVLNLYDANDARYNAYFKDNVYTLNGWTGTLLYKYNEHKEGEDMGVAFSFKPMRLAEMYLIAAEALALTDEVSARGYLNDLREKRITGYTRDNSISGASLTTAIWEERVKELFAEGQYLFDVKRLNKTIQRVAQPNTQFNTLSVSGDDDRLVFPIPTSEVNANPNIN